jgi:alpha-tubulin suppressor-like RCC1 family protein
VALLGNGHVMAWGLNSEGQLGDGTTTGPEFCWSGASCSGTPAEVSGLSTATAVSAGWASLALLSDGTVMHWGAGTDVPVAISGLSGVAAISAGGYASLALLGNGHVMAWGSENFEGFLGNGTTTGSATPVPVCAVGWVGPCPSGPYLSEVTAISAGTLQSLALLSNGTVVVWGRNAEGQLGNGTFGGFSDVPVAVSGLSGVTAVSSGGRHNLALLSNGTAMAWGWNYWGQLGIGTTTDSAVPVAIGQSGLVGISSGWEQSLAFRSPTPTITAIKPTTGSVEGGTTVTITGNNFTGATAVKFGSSSAASFTAKSVTITAVSPAEPSGTVDVTVTTPVGTTAISTKDRFKFLPTVTGLTPNSGSSIGGTSITVTGTGFAPGTSATKFKFGGTAGKSVNCTSSTTCTVVAPAHALGTVDVKATVNSVSSVKNAPADQFTYE